MAGSLIEEKRRERDVFLRALYESVGGREGSTIAPMQYYALGAQTGLQKEAVSSIVHFLVSEGLLAFKPATEAVGLTRKGIVETERQLDVSTVELREARHEPLRLAILNALRTKREKVQMGELKDILPEFSDIPDPDWYAIIDGLLSDGMLKAGVVRSGIHGAVAAAYNLEITPRGRDLVAEEAVEAAESKRSSGALPKNDDRKFAQLAVQEARKSVPEDERVHPKVGVVVVKNGLILAKSHRGEISQCHAEFIALERKLADESLAGSTVYTTLEPCTSRNHPKIPCAARLIERKVSRVLIGMLDPDDRISGRGQRALRRAGIATAFFDHDLMTEIEELNRDFIREKEAKEQSFPEASKKPHDSKAETSTFGNPAEAHQTAEKPSDQSSSSFDGHSLVINSPDRFSLRVSKFEDGSLRGIQLQIENYRLASIQRDRVTLSSACSFDAQHGAFRESCVAGQMFLRSEVIRPSFSSNPIPLIWKAPQWSGLVTGENNLLRELRWPNMDKADLQRWKLSLAVDVSERPSNAVGQSTPLSELQTDIIVLWARTRNEFELEKSSSAQVPPVHSAAFPMRGEDGVKRTTVSYIMYGQDRLLAYTTTREKLPGTRFLVVRERPDQEPQSVETSDRDAANAKWNEWYQEWRKRGFAGASGNALDGMPPF